ncbi:MAG: NAD(P)-dependent oxidoreductase, partial [Pseudomonadota bacterium]
MNYNAVILDAESLGTGDVSIDIIKEIDGVNVTSFENTSESQVLQRIDGCEVVFTNKVPLSQNTLSKATSVKYIGVLATGTNCVDLSYCEKHGITVRNVEKYGTASVTQHALMLLLNLVCKTQEQLRRVASGGWSSAKQFCVMTSGVAELSGKTAVVVGYGELGKQFCTLLEVLGMKVIIASAPGRETEDRKRIDDALPLADVVSLHCLLSESTKRMMNTSRFALMKKGAFFINTSRGGLVDEDALLQSLLSGH